MLGMLFALIVNKTAPWGREGQGEEEISAIGNTNDYSFKK